MRGTFRNAGGGTNLAGQLGDGIGLLGGAAVAQTEQGAVDRTIARSRLWGAMLPRPMYASHLAII